MIWKALLSRLTGTVKGTSDINLEGAEIKDSTDETNTDLTLIAVFLFIAILGFGYLVTTKKG